MPGAAGEPLDGAQRLELGEREVLGEPAGHGDAVDRLGRPAVGELRAGRDVGRAADLVLVPGDEHAVLGRDEVGLDVVGAHARSPARRTRACARAGSRSAPRCPMTSVSPGSAAGDPGQVE